MLVSVLIPAYNAEKYIKETLDCILNQTYTKFEIVIADDCSTDSTKKIIDSYSDPRIKRFHNEKNKKKPLTIQKLFENSTGDLITMHDADDVSCLNRFEIMVRFFQAHPTIGMCGHIIERMTEKGKHLGLFRSKVSDFGEIKKLMEVDNTDGDPSMFIRRNVLEELGVVFRPFFKNNMDYDLALRIIERYQTSNVLEVLSYYRNVEDSISKGGNSFEKLITQDITKFFAKERSEGREDALERGDMEVIDDLRRELSRPYLADKTLHFRKMAAFFMYCQMNRSAVNQLLEAIKSEPFKFENWRTLQYCIRKTIFEK